MKIPFFTFVLLLTTLLATPGYGQGLNLVPNPGFESYTDCPSRISMFELAQHWKQPNQGTTDYFNACSQGNAGVPFNQFGYQTPHFGQAYAGFYGFLSGRSYREFAQVRLTQPLQAGQVYYVEFFVLLDGFFDNSLDNLGAYFSSQPPSSENDSYLNYLTQPVQIRNPAGKYLADTLNWMKVAGSFQAQGGEQYLTIGNLDPDWLTNPKASARNQGSYYFLDDVSVSQCPLTSDRLADGVLCQGDSLVLDATLPGATYQWQDGSTSPRLPVKEAGTYWVDVQLPTCSFRDTCIIRAHSSFASHRAVRLCPNESSVLIEAKASGAVEYRWSDGSTRSSYQAIAGSYAVEVQLPNCSYTDSITVLPAAIINELPRYLPVCDTPFAVLDASQPEPASYQWSDGSTQPNLRVSRSGTYWVSIGIGACTFRQFTSVEFVTSPDILGSDQLRLCPGQAYWFVLDTKPLYTSYRWQDGTRGASLRIDQPGLYWVEVTLAQSGCRVRDSVRVDYAAAPHPFPARLALCGKQTALLDASILEGPYRWQDGSTNAKYEAGKAGTYWVEATWGTCQVRDSVEINASPVPTLQLRGDTLLCYGSTQVLEAVAEEATFRWQDGSTDKELSIQASGTYWVEATHTITGCSSRDSLEVKAAECWVHGEIPNVITPNGDQKNQSFFIEGLTDHWGLVIFNRWGQPIFQVESYQNDWDGSDQVNGVYYYQLQNWVSGQRYQGWLQVLR